MNSLSRLKEEHYPAQLPGGSNGPWNNPMEPRIHVLPVFRPPHHRRYFKLGRSEREGDGDRTKGVNDTIEEGRG